MLHTALLALLAGVFAGNGLPHFVRGITKESYPSVLGSGPVINLFAGWVGLVVAGVLLYVAETGAHPAAAGAAGAAGVLAMGLFHAGPGAFGRRA